jgi:hypothetical protein
LYFQTKLFIFGLIFVRNEPAIPNQKLLSTARLQSRSVRKGCGISYFGGVLQPGQLPPMPVKTLHEQYRQSHAVFGLSEKILSLVYKVIKCIFCINPHFIDLNFYKK